MPILQDTKEHTCKQWKQCTSWVHCNLIPWLLYWSLSTSFPFLPALSISGLTTTCTVSRHTKMLLLNGHTCNLMWSDGCPIPKTSLLLLHTNNHLTSIWQYETRFTKIMHPKHKKEIQIMIPISTLVPTKMCLPLLGTTSFLPQVTLFSFLDLVCCEVFFYFFPIFCVNEVHCIINSTLP
jgi:hypothetical protein